MSQLERRVSLSGSPCSHQATKEIGLMLSPGLLPTPIFYDYTTTNLNTDVLVYPGNATDTPQVGCVF